VLTWPVIAKIPPIQKLLISGGKNVYFDNKMSIKFFQRICKTKIAKVNIFGDKILIKVF
jgi:hypothetical protein